MTTTAKQPTTRQILSEMRAKGHTVRPAGCRVNGSTAYTIKGKPGVHTTSGMAANFLGYAI
jgi:hypothetical protein